MSEVYMTPNPPAPNVCLTFDPDVCIGCNACVDACPRDCLMPNPVKGSPPIVLYPEECWYCGSCREDCPKKDENASELHHPLNQSVVVMWKRKETGEIFRLGMKNPPSAYNKPPVG